jgi:hypothetical protein
MTVAWVFAGLLVLAAVAGADRVLVVAAGLLFLAACLVLGLIYALTRFVVWAARRGS